MDKMAGKREKCTRLPWQNMVGKTFALYICYFHHQLCECMRRAEPNFAVGYTFCRAGGFFIMKSQTRRNFFLQEQLMCVVLHRAFYICKSSMLAEGQVLSLNR